MSTPATPNIEALIAALGGEVRAAVATLNGQIETLTSEIRSARNDATQSIAFATKDLARLDARVESLQASADRTHAGFDTRLNLLEVSSTTGATYGDVIKWVLNAALVVSAAVAGHFFQ